MRAERRHPARPKWRVSNQCTDFLQEGRLAPKPNRIPKQLGHTVSREYYQARTRLGSEVWGDARRSPPAPRAHFVTRARATIEDRKQSRPEQQERVEFPQS